MGDDERHYQAGGAIWMSFYAYTMMMRLRRSMADEDADRLDAAELSRAPRPLILSRCALRFPRVSRIAPPAAPRRRDRPASSARYIRRAARRPFPSQRIACIVRR